MTSNSNSKTMSEQTQTLAVNHVPRGKYKSGRIWKSERKRFSSLVSAKPLKKPLSKKIKLRKERKEILALTASIRDEKRRKAEELRERQKLNKERRMQNERKAEVVQVIKNTKKLKRMSKKQLKYIETRDTSQLNNKNKT